MNENYIYFNENIPIDNKVYAGINNSYFVDNPTQCGNWRNRVYGSVDTRRLSYVGLVESVKSYEKSLGIEIASKFKHTKILAGVITQRDKQYYK